MYVFISKHFLSGLSKRINAFYLLLSFCCSTVLPDKSQKSRQKTRVVKRTANPMFNHTMVYDGFQPEDLREACVEITVWDHDRLNNHYIGGLRLGLGTGEIRLHCYTVTPAVWMCLIYESELISTWY